ncbi:MAG TPA: hypothetical protein VN256_01960 [Pyrinomonadaceae bacterium]|nr:hypothetical protein [Pyrinomonadaceae bacterium]
MRARALLLLWLLLAAAGNTASAQQPAPGAEGKRKAVSYTFVSPNTREGLTLAEALRLLDSREEFLLISNIRGLARCLRLRPLAVRRTIGSWADGAEHAALFRLRADEPTLRYADARLGKLAQQKAVLYFRRDERGADRMYVLRLRRGKRSLASVSKTLDASGVAFRTLAPAARGRLLIYVVDLDDALRRQVVRAARLLRAAVSAVKGEGEFLGDDADREKAQQVFAAEIKNYEDENPDAARRCSRQ